MNGVLKICHAKRISFSHDRYLALRISLCGTYDIITLSKTSLHPDKHLCFNLGLPGYHPILRRDRVDRIWRCWILFKYLSMSRKKRRS